MSFLRRTEKELYWLAGWLEGEGCFSIRYEKHPVVAATSTDKDVIEKVARLTGSKVYKRKKHESQILEAWQIRVPMGHMKQLLLDLQPIMGSRRRDKIQKCLDAYDLVERQCD